MYDPCLQFINYIKHISHFIKREAAPSRYKYKIYMNMETIKLDIPNMKSPHCQMRVTNVVKAVGGEDKSISPAKAEIELAGSLTRDEVVRAITHAGYNVKK